MLFDGEKDLGLSSTDLNPSTWQVLQGDLLVSVRVLLRLSVACGSLGQVLVLAVKFIFHDPELVQIFDYLRRR